MHIFANDLIYAPEIVPKALEWAWKRWRDGTVDNNEVLTGLAELFQWIDQTARAKPQAKLWHDLF
jgi:hypothetical protein